MTKCLLLHTPHTCASSSLQFSLMGTMICPNVGQIAGRTEDSHMMKAFQRWGSCDDCAVLWCTLACRRVQNAAGDWADRSPGVVGSFQVDLPPPTPLPSLPPFLLPLSSQGCLSGTSTHNTGKSPFEWINKGVKILITYLRDKISKQFDRYFAALQVCILQGQSLYISREICSYFISLDLFILYTALTIFWYFISNKSKNNHPYNLVERLFSTTLSH